MLSGQISDATLLLTLSAEAALTDLQVQERFLLRMEMHWTSGIWSGPYASSAIKSQQENVDLLRAQYKQAEHNAMVALKAEREERDARQSGPRGAFYRDGIFAPEKWSTLD